MAQPTPRHLRVFASLIDDMSNGHVWLSDPSLGLRSIAKITNTQTDKTIYCEALQIDDNFLNAYAAPHRKPMTDPESAIVMSHWYRSRLGIGRTQVAPPFRVTRALWGWGQFRACTGHPQVVVRVAVWLGLSGVIISGIGTAATLWPALGW
jgi:hypothetical protein